MNFMFKRQNFLSINHNKRHASVFNRIIRPSIAVKNGITAAILLSFVVGVYYSAISKMSRKVSIIKINRSNQNYVTFFTIVFMC
jgi:hypothetical protein